MLTHARGIELRFLLECYAMFTMRLFFLIVALVVALPSDAQTTYRWVGKSGQVVYSDQPPPPGTQAVEMKDGQDAKDAQQLPYATRVAKEKYPVSLYTTAACTEVCADARALLNGRGIPFSEKLLTTPDQLSAAAKLMGNESFVPGLIVGSQKVPGFEATALNNLLDLAGYPKAAPYGSKPSGAFSQ